MGADSTTLTHAYININTSTKTENLLKKGWSHSQRREERRRKRAVTCHKTHKKEEGWKGRGRGLFFWLPFSCSIIIAEHKH